MHEKPLTEDQWLSQHKSKFDKLKLSLAERKRRYTSYASTLAGQGRAHDNARSLPRRIVQSKARSSTSATKRVDDSNELLISMSDPFSACSREGHLARIPDGTMKETGLFKFKFNVDVYSDQSGRAFFFFDACPFRCFATGSTISDIAALTGGDITKAENGYVANAEFNAFVVETGRAPGTGSNVGYMPDWTEGSWSIAIVRESEAGTVPPSTLVAQAGLGMQPAVGAEALQTLAQSWRTVCAGMKFRNTAKVLDRQGAVAVARYPGALGIPTVANQLLIVQNDTAEAHTLPSTYAGAGPNFNTVQTLPDAEVFAVSEGFTMVWAPQSSEAHACWRPVNPRPMFSPSTFEGLAQFSDTATTGVYILPDPCNGDPSTYKALIDRLYTQNANVNNDDALADSTYGHREGLYFQEYTGSASLNDAITSYALRDQLHGHNQTSMITENNALIACFEGCDPQTLLGTMEVVLGVEYLADSRTVATGNGPNIEALSHIPKSKQLDIHEATIHAINAIPPAVETATSTLGQVTSTIGQVAGAVETAAPYVEAALTALAAFL